jgi:hypothetical protein
LQRGGGSYAMLACRHCGPGNLLQGLKFSHTLLGAEHNCFYVHHLRESPKPGKIGGCQTRWWLELLGTLKVQEPEYSFCINNAEAQGPEHVGKLRNFDLSNRILRRKPFKEQVVVQLAATSGAQDLCSGAHQQRYCVRREFKERDATTRARVQFTPKLWRKFPALLRVANVTEFVEGYQTATAKTPPGTRYGAESLRQVAAEKP